ncbi:CorA metal ion transporter [Myotisia sp. PD_48]|nr:CorA metal ion transporter [Myotisia sp. PD_48]
MEPSNQDGQASRRPARKRRHRGHKKRKDRRPSFAPPPSESPPHNASADVPEHVAGDGAGETQSQTPAKSHPFYRLGSMMGRNLSESSLESEALLDHRKQPMMRTRRESRLAQSYRPSQPSATSPPDSPSGRARRIFATGYSSHDEDMEEATDRTPLIRSGSFRHSGAMRYGNDGSGPLYSTQQQNAMSSSLHSPDSKFRPGASGDQRPDYDINNPPSVPGSPKTGPEMGYDDAMITGQEYARSASPEARSPSSLPVDAIIDIDRDNQPEELSPLDTTLQRRRTVTLPVEEDVCFPTMALSDIGEEELQSHAPTEGYPPGRRRRRRREWPDISALEEWSQEEKEARSGGSRSKKISEPVLIGGRLRTQGSIWKHYEEEDAPYRFTYFNEDLQSTIHSQTISELVQPGQTFRNLFIPDPPELESDSSDDEDDETPEPNGNGSGSVSLSPHQTPASNIPDLLSDDPDHPSNNSNHNHTQHHTEKPKRYGPRPTFWLDVLSPTDTEMRVIAKAFGIHALTAEDIMMQEAREKVELFRNYYFLNYRTFEQDDKSPDFLEPVNMYVVVFREGLLSFHFSRTPHPANVRRRIRQLKDYLILNSDWISYAIIDDITDAFGPLIHSIEDDVDDIDDTILRLHSDDIPAKPSADKAHDTAVSGSDMLRRIGSSRKQVMGLYRLLGNKADVIKGFAKRCNEQWEVAPKSEIGLYLGDIQDHILTMTSNLTHYETLLSRAHSNYLAQINIRMNERQEQTADVLGKLTVLGTIVLPMNIICGMWGMNVKVPGQEVDSLNWFLSITAGLVVFAVVCFYVAKRVYGIM